MHSSTTMVMLAKVHINIYLKKRYMSILKGKKKKNIYIYKTYII